MVKNQILSVGVTNATQEEVLEYVINSLEKRQENYYIVTPNPEMVVSANVHPQFKEILNKAELALCDGIGLVWAGKFLGKPFKERYTGVDFVESLCSMVSKKPITVGFLGGRGKVAELAADCLQKKYPGLKVVFVSEEWSKDAKKNQSSTFHHLPSKIDALFVAFGFPKQEQWMAQHIGKAPVKIMVGVGGAFDYISGKVARAPKWVQRFGFEWLFRLILEPWRWRRQRALIQFLWLVFLEKLKGKD